MKTLLVANRSDTAIRGTPPATEPRAPPLPESAGVPIVPGTAESISEWKDVQREAKRIGFPLIIKAAHGGGGRGMRVVKEMSELQEKLAEASREAGAAFGKGEVFLERFIQKAKHIEVQLLGDSKGNLVHLFERDCSVQRRHQKVVELAPA